MNRHKLLRRMFGAVLALVLFVSSVFAAPVAHAVSEDEAPTDPSVDASDENTIVHNGGFFTDNVYVAQRLDVIFSEFPVGSYFSYTGKPCTCHNKCSYFGGCDCISDYNDPEKDGKLVRLYSCQCMGFAHYSFYKIFGFVASLSYPSNASKYYSVGSLSSSKMTVENVKKLLSEAKTGADIRIRDKHSVVLLSQDEEGLYILQANWVSPCMVNIKYWTWEEFTSRYKSYGIEYVYMPNEYPESVGEYIPPALDETPVVPQYQLGYYQVTASNSGLRLRSGPGTDYGQLDLLPHDTLVEVTEVKDGWGKVVYNGKTGWIALTHTEFVLRQAGLTVTVPEDRIFFYVGSVPDFSNLLVELTDSEGATLALNTGQYSVSYSAPSPGEYTATVTAGNDTCSFDFIALPYGDLNADGRVSVVDAMLLARAADGSYSLTSRQKEGADTNGNGTVDRADADRILAYLTGRVPGLPAKEA